VLGIVPIALKRKRWPARDCELAEGTPSGVGASGARFGRLLQAIQSTSGRIENNILMYTSS